MDATDIPSPDIEDRSRDRARGGRRAVLPIVGGIVFLVAYLAVDVASAALATSALPLPGAPASEVAAYLRDNTAAAVATAVLQALSVAGLALVVAVRANALLPLGQLLCMVWTVSAGVSLARGRTVPAAA